MFGWGLKFAAQTIGGFARAFDPAGLFRNGEVGVYYDPSDMSTLFQNSAGTTPVTAAGQPVGLMLDKSQGLELGPETIVNGTFDTNTTGWAGNNANATLTWQSGGTALFQNVAAFAYVQSSANLPLVAGKSYKVSFDVIAISHTSTIISVGPGGSAFNIDTTIPKSYSYVYRATGPVTFQIRPNNVGVGTIQIDNISVKLLSGNHATQPTAGKRPLLKSTSGKWWLDFDVIDDELIATFPSSLGSACTIGKALNPASTIAGAQTIGTTYTMNADNFSTVITNDALTADETAKLQTWLDKKAGNV